MNSWADVTWSIWKQVAGDAAGDLQYIFDDHITTATTKQLIESVEGLGADMADRLDLPWPGHKYGVETPNGLALLGSPHGVGVSWLYVNGKGDLGKREGITVTVFSGPEGGGIVPSGRFDYFLLWDLGTKSGV